MNTLIFVKCVGGVVALTGLGFLSYSLAPVPGSMTKRPISPAKLTQIKERNRNVQQGYLSDIQEIRTLKEKGDFKGALAKYEAMLNDPEEHDNPEFLKSYARTLSDVGQKEEALEIVKPLIFQNPANGDFEAIDFYDQTERKVGGRTAQKAFRDRIRDNSLDGRSLRRFNVEGLTDDEAMDYVRGGYAEGKANFPEAYRQYEKIARNYPPSFLFYSSMMGVLGGLHRQREIIPLYEDWYRHSSPEMKAQIKKRCFLDFKRLDAQATP